MRGHLQCRDTLAGNEGCPLKTGTTVQGINGIKVMIRTLKLNVIVKSHNVHIRLNKIM